MNSFISSCCIARGEFFYRGETAIFIRYRYRLNWGKLLNIILVRILTQEEEEETSGTEIENLPSISVIVPRVVPFTNIEAPTTGCPSSSEVTKPVTLDVCAVTRPIPIKRKVIKNINFLFINSLLNLTYKQIFCL